MAYASGRYTDLANGFDVLLADLARHRPVDAVFRKGNQTTPLGVGCSCPGRTWLWNARSDIGGHSRTATPRERQSSAERAVCELRRSVASKAPRGSRTGSLDDELWLAVVDAKHKPRRKLVNKYVIALGRGGLILSKHDPPLAIAARILSCIEEYTA